MNLPEKKAISSEAINDIVVVRLPSFDFTSQPHSASLRGRLAKRVVALHKPSGTAQDRSEKQSDLEKSGFLKKLPAGKISTAGTLATNEKSEI